MTETITPEKEKEQECLKSAWLTLQNLRFELGNAPVLGRTKRKDQLDWFDRVFGHIATLKIMSDCRKYARKLDSLADAIAKAIGPKRILKPSLETTDAVRHSSERVISEVDQKRLVERTDKMLRSVQRRMRKLHVPLLKPNPPPINTTPSDTKFVYVIGMVSLYPVMFAQLARSIELVDIAPFLAILGAILSFMFFIELTAIYIAKPFWVWNQDVAGTITHRVVSSQKWSAVGFIFVGLLFVSQGRWLLESLWVLISPLGITAYAIAVSIIAGLFSIAFYPWTKWRYNQFLYCPVCGFKAISHGALNAHSLNKHGYSIQEIVEHDRKTRKRIKKDRKRELRERVFLLMIPFYVFIEILYFLRYRNMSSLLLMLILCAFFFVLDILKADFISYQEIAKDKPEERKRADREAISVLGVLIGMSLIVTK